MAEISVEQIKKLKEQGKIERKGSTKGRGRGSRR